MEHVIALADAVGVTRALIGSLSPEEIKWFEKRGVTEDDIRLLRLHLQRFTVAFYYKEKPRAEKAKVSPTPSPVS